MIKYTIPKSLIKNNRVVVGSYLVTFFNDRWKEKGIRLRNKDYNVRLLGKEIED